MTKLCNQVHGNTNNDKYFGISTQLGRVIKLVSLMVRPVNVVHDLWEGSDTEVNIYFKFNGMNNILS